MCPPSLLKLVGIDWRNNWQVKERFLRRQTDQRPRHHIQSLRRVILAARAESKACLTNLGLNLVDLMDRHRLTFAANLERFARDDDLVSSRVRTRAAGLSLLKRAVMIFVSVIHLLLTIGSGCHMHQHGLRCLMCCLRGCLRGCLQ